MFHKALWMRNWKLGKYVVFIFFISTLYFLPYEYHQAAQEQQQLFSHPELLEDGKFYYDYSFYSSDIFWLAIVIIALACLLIGWERSSQSGNILMAMPFKRRDIFLSKWLFGTFFIVGSFLINWVLMYFIYKSTIHFEYQSFGPFHRYFLYAIVSYVAIYTASLCIGTFTGSIISQSFFSITFCVIGMGFFSLLIFFFTTHVDAIDKKIYMNYESLYTIGKKQTFQFLSCIFLLITVIILNPSQPMITKEFHKGLLIIVTIPLKQSLFHSSTQFVAYFLVCFFIQDHRTKIIRKSFFFKNIVHSGYGVQRCILH